MGYPQLISKADGIEVQFDVTVHVRRRVGLVQKSVEFPAAHARSRRSAGIPPDQLALCIRIHVVLVAA